MTRQQADHVDTLRRFGLDAVNLLRAAEILARARAGVTFVCNTRRTKMHLRGSKLACPRCWQHHQDRKPITTSDRTRDVCALFQSCDVLPRVAHERLARGLAEFYAAADPTDGECFARLGRVLGELGVELSEEQQIALAVVAVEGFSDPRIVIGPCRAVEGRRP